MPEDDILPEIDHITASLFRRGEGRVYRLGEIILAFKSSPASGPDAFSIFESDSAPGSGAGYHRHFSYDEMHVVVEGFYDFILGTTNRRLGPGDMAYVPKGVPHGMINAGPGRGRQLVISSPAGVFEAFIAEVVGENVDGGKPTSGVRLEFRDIAKKHGIEFLELPGKSSEQ